MIDFKVKGTKLPSVPEGTKYRCTHWDGGCLDLGCSYDNWISYGVTKFEGVEYVLAERPGYDAYQLFMVSTSDIERLAAEQSMTSTTLTELPEYWVVRQDLTNPGWKKVIEYLNAKSGYGWFGHAYNYYGTEPNCAKGVNCYDEISQFLNNPTLLTIEEFLRLTNQKSETMVTIKRKELQKIHDIACDGWKQRIANIAKDQPFGDIKLSQAKVDKMFKAATPKQLPVLEKIFDKRVTLDMDAILRQIEVRKNWNLAGVSFFLPGGYTWKVVTDDIGVQCLVPTRK
jgi:hypothetical protein